jgi:hypothetical protein
VEGSLETAFIETLDTVKNVLRNAVTVALWATCALPTWRRLQGWGDDLELQCKLRGEELLANGRVAANMGETVLDFALQIVGETVAERSVDAPDIVAPLHLIVFIRHGSEELLIPA